MKNNLELSICIAFLLCLGKANAQTIPDVVLTEPWKASWITVPGESPTAYGVYLFRKSVNFSSKPSSLVIHVSADNRYKLFVNEQPVSVGPARGDVSHWNFETIDIAPYLTTGNNSIAAQVWNEGDLRPEGQISVRTGFILQGADNINTDTSWRCVRDSSYRPIRINLRTYFVAGPGELIDMQARQKDWQKSNFDDRWWKKAQVISQGTPKNFEANYGTPNGWMLIPSILPQMEMTRIRFQSLRKADGISIDESFPRTPKAITIPANKTVTLLLDQRELVNAYPVLNFSAGKNATIALYYAESMYTNYPAKGNRDEVEGKQFVGRKDSLLSDGSPNQVFTSLAWRTYRYVQVLINTKEEPLVIGDISGIFTGYPFQNNTKFESDDPELNKVLGIGWRTARLCAVETYMDCPYYEQLQYIGDARIQALVSLYNSGDDRLLKNALNLMDQSRQPEGVTLSRHPSYTPQYIPTFSLWYISMLHDYWMYGNDSNFIKDKLAGTREILKYFRKYQRADGSLAKVPYWLFTDWVNTKGWRAGAAPASNQGVSALMDLQLLNAYEVAADLEDRIGIKSYAVQYRQYAMQLKITIRNKYWNASRQLFADRQDKDLYSQHANALAILTGVADKQEITTIGRQIVSDTTLAPASIYFKYYLHRALIKAGMGNDYLKWLDKWRENISMGLTTWAENSEVNTSRSDCHAWGSSPNIELFRTVLGIDSDAPGFSKVRIEPHPGELNNMSGEMPHPRGKLSVQYKRNGNQWTAMIMLPPTVTGSLIWKGKTYPVKSGENSFKLSN